MEFEWYGPLQSGKSKLMIPWQAWTISGHSMSGTLGKMRPSLSNHLSGWGSWDSRGNVLRRSLALLKAVQVDKSFGPKTYRPWSFGIFGGRESLTAYPNTCCNCLSFKWWTLLTERIRMLSWSLLMISLIKLAGTSSPSRTNVWTFWRMFRCSNLRRTFFTGLE